MTTNSASVHQEGRPSLLETSYAQNREDIVLARGLTHRDGFYVDVGAFDPEIESVTKLFYERGWRGINVEPVPAFLDRFEIERPRDINIRAAISDRDGDQDLWVSPAGVPGHSTLDSSIAESHAADGLAFTRRSVPTLRLDTLFEKFLPPETTVDFLKIDAEGAEHAVLASWDPNRVRPRAIVVESIAPHVEGSTHNDWEHFLVEAEYRLVLFDGLNRFYVRNDEPDLAAQVAVPANILDPFEPIGYRKFREFADEIGTELAKWKSWATSLRERATWLEEQLAATSLSEKMPSTASNSGD